MNFNLNLNNRNILILGILVIIVVAALAYFLLIGPLFGRLGQASEERDAKEQQLSQLQAQVQDLERVRQNAGDIEQKLLQLNKRIPEEPEIPTLLVQIQEIADASGATQIRIEPGTPGPPPGGGPYSIVPITMSFEGTYDDMQDFLLRSNDLARLVTVNNVSYEPVQDETGASGGDSPLLSVEIEAEVYFQPQGASGGAAPIAPTAPETTTTTEETTS